jgi:hypothetical protein
MAATGSTSAAIANSLLMQPLAFIKALGRQHLLTPAKCSELLQTITFSADVMQDFLQYDKGENVKVELDLFGSSTISIRSAAGYASAYPVQLLLGTPCADGWPF